MTFPKTAWVQTGVYVGGVPIKEVSIPKTPRKAKGQTKYDEQFDKMLQRKTAIEIHEDHFNTMRRAIMRYREYRNLKGTLTVRQQIDPTTRLVTLWFETKEQSK
jgi:hypothetical protein